MYNLQYELRPEYEYELFPHKLIPPHVLNHVAELLKVQQQIELGNTNSQKLVEFVFFTRYPQLKGKVNINDVKYKEERQAIFFNIVAPALNSRAQKPPTTKQPPSVPKQTTDVQEIWKLLKWFLGRSGHQR